MENDEQAIRELVESWLNASAAGDTEKLLTLMAEDVVFLMAGQPPIRGRAAFAAAQAALRPFRVEASSEIQEIKVFGDWAYCWNQLSVTVTSQRRRICQARRQHLVHPAKEGRSVGYRSRRQYAHRSSVVT